MPRTNLLAIVSILCCVSTLRAQDNVLIIIADDLGTDYVGAYGEGTAPAPTPNLDALAGQGVLFRNVWVNPSCTPTRACFHTGRHAYRTGIGEPGPGNVLPDAEATFAERLTATGSGHATGYIGKWHLGGGPGNHPNDQGWSHFAGIIGGGVADYYSWPREVNGVSATSTTYTTTQIVDDALAWIGAQTGPWVCVVAFNAPHTPFHAPPAGLHSQTLPTGDPNANPIPFYTAAVEAMDTEIGRLASALAPQLPQTNVLFFGDNGTPNQVSIAPFVSTHAKGTPYEGGVGVPMIASGPIVASPGREVAELVSVVDVFASVGDLVGRDLTPPFVRQDSVSFVPYLTDPAQGALRTMIYSEQFTLGAADTSGFAAARSNRWKLIRRYTPAGTVTEEFYNLFNDPFETNNLLPGLAPFQTNLYNQLAAKIDEVRDRTGRFETLGVAACTGSAGIPQIAGIGTPQVNATYGVGLTDAPASTPAWLAIGLSTTFDATFGFTLPYDTSGIGGGSGCVLTTSLDILEPAVTDATGSVTAPVFVPDIPQLVAGSVLHSWLVLDPTANALGLTVTTGLRAVFGE